MTHSWSHLIGRPLYGFLHAISLIPMLVNRFLLQA